MNFNEKLENILKQNEKFCDSNNELLKQKVKSYALEFDEDLIATLLECPDTREHFFKKISDATIFNYRKFIDFMDDKNFLLDSYTKFSNKVGLTISNKHIKQIDDVVLTFPFKDCVLEGGQSKEDENRKEIFFNETLAKDEINRLLDKKVITNATKYYYSESLNEVKETQDIKFTRNKDGVITDNLIIKGNNLLVLHTLKSNFAGKVKLIYIDPPYNTGNDSFGYNDSFNHSTWLTFMKNRLEIAKELLADDGVMFVQIDDNQQAYLKVLMDEIFGRENFIGDLIRKTKSVTNDAKIGFNIQHENTLIFAKFKNKVLLNGTKKELENYKNPDSDINGNWTSSDPSARTGKTNFEIINPYTKKIDLPPQGRCWAFSKESFEKFVKSGKIKFKKTYKETERGFIYKRYESELKSLFNLLNSLDGANNKYMNQVATKEKNKFHFMEEFDYPKPEEFLKLIIESSTKENDLILDFFGGSGTTCAVAHKIKRKYIMIEQMNYIHDMPEARIKEVIKGEQGGISKSIDWQGGGEFIYLELDKYNQKFIDDLSVATEKNILDIYDEICEKGFLNYDIELTKIKEHFEEFKAFSLDQQKEFLISMLNKNQLYKNLSEIDDKDLEVSDKIKELNKSFYNIKDI